MDVVCVSVDADLDSDHRILAAAGVQTRDSKPRARAKNDEATNQKKSKFILSLPPILILPTQINQNLFTS